MKTIKVKEGEVLLRPPLGGAIQDALIKGSSKNGANEAEIMVELIPNMIHSHPFGITPIRTALRKMEGADYLAILKGAKEYIQPLFGDDTEKNLEEPSESSTIQKENSGE